MSSSGKWRQTNTNHPQRQNKNIHKTQIRNESTNMFMCNLCLMYAHPLPRVDPSRSRSFQDTTQWNPLPPFKICFPSLLFCWAQISEATAPNLWWIEWTSSWPTVGTPVTNYSLYRTGCKEIKRNVPPGFHPKEAGRPLSALSSQCPELSFSIDPPELRISISNHSQSLCMEPKDWWFHRSVQDGMPSVTMSSVPPFPHLW